jgi:hydrogenase maturation protease
LLFPQRFFQFGCGGNAKLQLPRLSIPSALGFAKVKKILILGVGNILLADEGVGVHVVRRLMEMELPPHVEVIDGGTGGLDLLPYFRDKERVIIIDALKVEEEPGSIYRLHPGDFGAGTQPILSLHQLGIAELLESARLLGFNPEVTIFGIAPKDIESCSLELTPEVERAIPKVIRMILDEIG